MPIFMDLHIVPGVTAKEVAEAHLLDVKIQEKYCCRAMTYWIDEDKGSVFCLIEAPDKESVREMHEKAHGLIPHEIISVNTDVVKAFLGRIKDPEDAIQQPDTDLKVFSDPAFRIMLVTKAMDSRLLQHDLNKDRARELLLLYSTIVREQTKQHGGREVYLREEGFVISFTSGVHATECAIAIRKKLVTAAALIDLRIALHAGMPVDHKGHSIFETTIQVAQFLGSIAKPNEIIMSAVVRNLFKDNDWNLAIEQDNIRSLGPADDSFLITLIDTLSARWQDAEFDVPEFCRVMSLSKSQLYRKCVAITGLSPNILLREYRLQRSLEFLKKEDRNIAQTTFDTGFSSPSYFTKCFQKRFGIQPLAYLRTQG
jgi:AraC-like DNA-binding protein